MTGGTFLLPDLGEGLEGADVVQWLVAVGDVVMIDQPIVEVETAKANVEIPSPFSGVVATLHAEAGMTVAVGAPLVTITGDAVATSDEPKPRESVVPTASPGLTPERPLVGFGVPEEARRAAVAVGAAAAPATVGSSGPGRVPASPPVRKRARELGIDLACVPGSGPHGAVIGRDLDAVMNVDALVNRDTPMNLGEVSMAYPASTGEPVTERRRIPVRGVRRLVAEKMATSRREIPDATTWVDCDATDLVALCASMNAWQTQVKVTPLAVMLRACVAALGRYPVLNARFDETAGEIELLGPIHMGIAAQTDRGLMVPVIRDAHTRSTLEIARELRRLAGAARDGSITPRELVGSTFTVSNYGAFGVDGGVAIINHPEVAILGVGRIVERPWVFDGGVAIRSVVQLSLSFDHRVMDGSDAGGFTRFVADCVESPAALLAML